MKESIYFIAIVPPPEICREVRGLQLYAQAKFGSGHALRSPAHITLQPPFRWKPSELPLLDESLKSFVISYTSFQIALNNFSAFPPRVIFIEISENEDLKRIQKSLSKTLKDQLDLVSDRPDRAFHPHMTIAFKDLKKARFDAAWAHFSSLTYQRYFEVRSIFLLKHEYKRWEICEEYCLNQ